MKTFLLSFCIVSLLALAVMPAITLAEPDQACITQPANLVSWWPGQYDGLDIWDENNATLMNGVAFAPGKVGQAFSFDGVDDYVYVPDNPSLHPISAITVIAWVKMSSSSPYWAPIIMKAGSLGPGGYALDTVNGSVFFEVYLSEMLFMTSQMAYLAADQWNLVAGVYDGTAVSIYIDGVLSGTPNPASGSIESSVNPLTLGHSISNTNLFFQGLIDEVQVFDRALSAAEIQAIYTAGSAGQCALYPHKVANKGLAAPGSRIDYTIWLNNISDGNFANVAFTDTLPATLQYIDGSLQATNGTSGYNNGVISWSGSVSASQDTRITFGATASPSVAIGDTITNTARISIAGQVITRTVTIRLMHLTYLPFLSKPFAGFTGKVTLNGSPAAGVPLELRLLDGDDWSTSASTTTSADGTYTFLDPPALLIGDAYAVLYTNTSDPSRVKWWISGLNMTYNATSMVTVAPFDIANITLSQPDPGAAVDLPYTFTWTKRPATWTDSYKLALFDPADNDPWYWSDPLGYVDRVTLTGLPYSFPRGVPLKWSVWVYSPDGGYGEPYYYRDVNIKGCPTSYSDDFSNPASGWAIENGSDYAMGYLNGEYRIAANPGWMVFSTRDFYFINFRAEVDVRPVGPLDGGAGLILAESNDDFYLFEISDGWYGLWRAHYEPWSLTTLIDWTASPAVHAGYQSNRLQVSYIDSRFALYANGQLLATINDSHYLGWRFGMVSEGFSANYDSHFDNFTMYSGICLGTAPIEKLPTLQAYSGGHLTNRGTGSTRP